MDICVPVIVLNVTWEDYTNHVSLLVDAPYLVATIVTFPVQMSVLHVQCLVGTTAITVDVLRNVVSHVFLVWRIVSGSVSISDVLRNVVRCVIALVVMIHVLNV